MPGRRRKRFIDKKNAVTFHLVHRSQRDPLQADEDAPQRVLLPTDEAQAAHCRKQEQREFGVFYDDDYDYMQHLKDVNELYQVEPIESYRVREGSASDKGNKLKLPSTVFASEQETEIGLLNKAAPLRGPQLDWDPDIVAGLDEDFDFDNPENQLEDDFVVQAMEGEVDYHMDEEEISHQKKRVTISEGFGREDQEDIPSDEAEQSDVGSDFGGSFDDEQSFTGEETKSRFTNYSMSSSVIRRNEGLTLLDDRFEKIFEQYDDEEMGALDDDDITGFAPQNSDLLNSALEEFEEQMKQVTLEETIQKHDGEISDSESDGEMVPVPVDEKPKEKWDCESILSTLSNLYNHPKLIKEPKKTKPIKMKMIDGTEIPADVLSKRGLTKKQLQELEKAEEGGTLEYIPTYRPKDETKEEKKARKSLMKEGRRARREEKKTTKLAFKSEKQKQEKDLLSVRQAQQSVRIV